MTRTQANAIVAKAQKSGKAPAELDEALGVLGIQRAQFDAFMSEARGVTKRRDARETPSDTLDQVCG